MNMKELSNCDKIKFIAIYSKDKRVFTILSNYLGDLLQTGSYAKQEPINREELNATLSMTLASPLGYSRWLTCIDTNSVKVNRDVATKMQEGSYTTNLIYSDNFKTHNIVRKLFSYPQQDYLELTFITFNYEQMMFFHDLLVPEERKLNSNVLKKLLKGYRTRPEKILDLFYYLQDEVITTYPEIIKLLGSPDNTQEKFLLKLLEVEIISDRSLKTQMKNRYIDLEDLVLQIGYDAMLGYLKHTLKQIIYVKEQYVAGVFYKDLNRQRPEYRRDGTVYEDEDIDTKFIRRKLGRNIEQIKNIPYSRFVLLLNCMNRPPFKDNFDTYQFLADYFIALQNYR